MKRYWWLFVLWIFHLATKCKLVHDNQSYYNWATGLRLLHKDCSPKVCFMCGNTSHKRRGLEWINGTECETEYRCSRCNNVTGYWAYGSFDI